MSKVPSIDLHPDKIRGDGPESALRACRDFLDRSIRAGHRQVRIITGVGLHGDGTARLLTRVEQEVLGAYFSQIEQQQHEQSGAVIRVFLKGQGQKPSTAWHRHQRHHLEQNVKAGREERLMVGFDRLEAAEQAFAESDWRRCRLKLNQVAKEFGLVLAPTGMDEALAGEILDQHWAALKALDC